jgi:hypothetical protein
MTCFFTAFTGETAFKAAQCWCTHFQKEQWEVYQGVSSDLCHVAMWSLRSSSTEV